ncbi:MAG TPA: L,D-transpeptidase family protein [Dissulfurispiraceae bacterium]|nr:L,D-transpeptidase family protein [Dissulfurispiraceae bacterium]
MQRISGSITITISVLIALVLALPAFAKVDQADSIVVIKSKRVMMLMQNGEILKSYRIALGGNPSGHKVKAGDKKTPEGLYTIDSRNPNSAFHLSLRISYPSRDDLQRAEELGVSPGGSIMIHGLKPQFARLGKLHREKDWTEGCIAVTDKEIQEIWRLVPDGTPIVIKP